VGYRYGTITDRQLSLAVKTGHLTAFNHGYVISNDKHQSVMLLRHDH
jgi:hypothetical protein